MAKGIRHAKDILTQPYRFLNEKERAGYLQAEKAARIASEEEANRVDGQTAKRGPGRPRGSKVREVASPPAKAVIMRINPETGKAERTGI